jgi:oligopeptidase A
MTDNPLLDFSGLPRFDAIKPEHVTPAIEHLLEKNRAAVAQLEAPSGNVTWDNFVTRWKTPPSCWAVPGASSVI